MRTRMAAFVGTVGRFVRRCHPWRESRLISRDGQMIYTVREREGDERQVLHRSRGWEPVSAARFSMLPCFEDYHREKFETAIRYTPNQTLCNAQAERKADNA